MAKSSEAKPTKEYKTSEPQRNAMRKYEKNKIEQLTVRLPKGSRAKIDAYVKKSDKYPSVNIMIKTLIEKEIKQKLDEKQSDSI